LSEYIKANGKVSESGINALIEQYKTDGALLFCVYTMKFCCTRYKPIEDITHALEIRLFDEQGELKAVRANIGRDFVWRYINDEGVPKDCTYDEKQYLDAAKNDSTEYIAIGGGHYEMPEAGFERVKICHYGEYDGDGIFSLKDFRIVKLLRKGEE
jgi:hypothetical protein